MMTLSNIKCNFNMKGTWMEYDVSSPWELCTAKKYTSITNLLLLQKWCGGDVKKKQTRILKKGGSVKKRYCTRLNFEDLCDTNTHTHISRHRP